MTKTVDIKKDLKKILIWSIIITLMLVAGIPMIIIGASKSIWIVLIIGIIFTVVGFYGSPIIWIYYSSFKTLKRIVEIIKYENLTSISEIANHIQISENQIKTHITNAIKKGYLEGYIFDGNNIKANEKEPIIKKKIKQTKCINCGGPLTETETGYLCEYCGSKFDNNFE